MLADQQANQQVEPEQPVHTLAEQIYNEEVTDFEEQPVVEEYDAHVAIEGSVLFTTEQIPPESLRLNAINLYRSFQPCQLMMTMLLRLPIVSSVKGDYSIVFEFYWHSVKGILFFITFSILSILTLFSTLSIMSTMLDFPMHPFNLSVEWDVRVAPDGNIQWKPIFGRGAPATAFSNQTVLFNKTQAVLRAEEMFFFRRNLAPLVMILLLVYHILTADYNLFTRRHFVASYLSFWTESVEIMGIDPAGKTLQFSKFFLMYYLGWFILFFLIAAFNFAPVVTGAPVSFAFLWIRVFYPPIHAVSDGVITFLFWAGTFMVLYIILASKIYVFFFLYMCKILTNACKEWNMRFERIFTNEVRSKSNYDKCLERVREDYLFKDYVNLLDLLNGADTLFANIIESYYSTTLVSIVFEVYYLARPTSAGQTEFSGARSLDVILVAIYFINTLVILYLVSRGAAQVGAAAAHGLEIIRRNGILGQRPESEMHLMISLYMSYTGHFDTALSGGGYFILDKPFFVALAGTMISYIIIIFQFQPTLGLSNEEAKALIGVGSDNHYNARVLLTHVESTVFYGSNDSMPGM